MKNIHVLATDKPSKLTLRVKTNELGYSYKVFANNGVEININQNIYITNDEEIKEGDYIFNLASKEVYPILELWAVVSYEKKIILTTDPQLISDGVQAIDDKFLEWFVKNTTCEWVEVTNDIRAFDNENREIDFAILKEDYIKILYKIIIPSEEPKNVVLGYKNSLDAQMLDKIGLKESKQQTLEEAACKALGYEYDYWLSMHSKDQSSLIYIEVTNWCKGAKRQQDQDKNKYSEEEVLELLLNCRGENPINIEQWFEIVKKK